MNEVGLDISVTRSSLVRHLRVLMLPSEEKPSVPGRLLWLSSLGFRVKVSRALGRSHQASCRSARQAFQLWTKNNQCPLSLLKHNIVPSVKMNNNLKNIFKNTDTPQIFSLTAMSPAAQSLRLTRVSTNNHCTEIESFRDAALTALKTVHSLVPRESERSLSLEFSSVFLFGLLPYFLPSIFYLWVHSSRSQTLVSINFFLAGLTRDAAAWVPSTAFLVSDFPGIIESDFWFSRLESGPRN